MKLNQNKKDKILNLPSCSKDLLIWIQLQALQEDIIEITHKHYTEGVKVSLNTFKKALGGLLDLKVLFATSKKGKFKLNKNFIADSYFYNSGLGDFDQRKMWIQEPSRIPMLDYKPYDKSTINEAVKYMNELQKTSPSLFDPVLTLNGFLEKQKQRESQMVDPEYINKLNLELQEEESKLK